MLLHTIRMLTSVGILLLCLHPLAPRADISSQDLTSIEPEIAVSYGNAIYSRASGEMSYSLSITNVSESPIVGPIYVLFSEFSAPSVRVARPNGITTEGVPYVKIANALLNTMEALYTRVSFSNPTRTRFTFTTEVKQDLWTTASEPDSALRIALPAFLSNAPSTQITFVENAPVIGEVVAVIALAASSHPAKESLAVHVVSKAPDISLEEWFGQYFDSDGYMQADGTYDVEMTDDGRALLRFVGPMPQEYEIGNLPLFVVESAGRQRVAFIEISHDHDIGQLGYPTSRELESFVREIMEFIEFSE